MQHSIHFTLDEANAALAEIRPMLRRIIDLKHALDEKGFDVYRHQYFGGMGPNGDRYFPRELEELAALAKFLDGRGIQLKSLENGLIDFPYIRTSGEEVYLCYVEGENEIAYWHTIADGFAGRQDLDSLEDM